MEHAGQVPLPRGTVNLLFAGGSLWLDLLCWEARRALLVHVPSRDIARSSGCLEGGMVSVRGRAVCLAGGATNSGCNIKRRGCNSL